MKALRAIFCIPILLAITQLHGQTCIFFTEDKAGHQWCAYRKAEERNAAVARQHEDTYGVLSYKAAKLSGIEVTHEDGEAGDWTVIDEYSIGPKGEIAKLRRKMNVLSAGDRSILQAYRIVNGRAIRISTAEKDLRTGQQLSPLQGAWHPDIPIWSDKDQLPILGLLNLPRLKTAAKSCAPEAQFR